MVEGALGQTGHRLAQSHRAPLIGRRACVGDRRSLAARSTERRPEGLDLPLEPDAVAARRTAARRLQAESRLRVGLAEDGDRSRVVASGLARDAVETVAASAVVQGRESPVELGAVVQVGSDDDVRVGIPVHVACRSNGDRERGTRLITVRRKGRGRREPRGRAVIDERPSDAIVAVGTDDHVRVAVAVDVPCGSGRMAEGRVRLVALGRPRRVRPEPRGRAEIDVGAALLRLAVVVARGPNDDVRVAVAVDVPRRRDRAAEASAQSDRSPPSTPDSSRGPRPSRDRRRRALVALAVVVELGPDDDVRVAVAVDVPRRGHRRCRSTRSLGRSPRSTPGSRPGPMAEPW